MSQRGNLGQQVRLFGAIASVCTLMVACGSSGQTSATPKPCTPVGAAPGAAAPQVSDARTVATFRSDTGMSSNYLTSAITTPPRKRWDIVVPGTTLSSFTTAGSTVVLSDRPWLCALDLDTAAPRWIDSDAGVAGTPSVAASRVFVASVLNRGLYAFDLQTGKLLWRTALPAPSPAGSQKVWPALAVPMSGMVYATSPQALTAVDETSGRIRWEAPISNPDSGLAAADGAVYVVDASGVLHALDGTSGAQTWVRSVGHAAVLPVAAGGVVVASSIPAGEVQAFQGPSGRPLWSSAPLAGSTGLALADGTVYDATESAGLVALDAATGTRTWSFSPPQDVPGPFRGEATTQAALNDGPSFAAGVLYVGNRRGNIFAVDAASHALLWEFHLPEIDAVLSGAPIQLSHGKLLFSIVGGETFALG